MSTMNGSSVDTVNAAANAIITAESRVQQVTIPRRRWTACFGSYWCFGAHKHNNRISNAVLVPEPTPASFNAPAPENPIHPPVLFPFIAPPSSPVSFLQSEPPSSIQSPAGGISFSALSANAYSSPGPASIFAIGPYAHETQLVSPPVFSTFTTEPSTASFTPPPEPIQFTTPSSPEVPFARLLTSSLKPNDTKDGIYEFPSYQLYPGSPIGHLISPSSAYSGTSSPFPDPEFHSPRAASFSKFHVGEPPKILSDEDLTLKKFVPRLSSRNAGSFSNGQIIGTDIHDQNDETDDHRVSFELTAEEVARCMEKKQTMSFETIQGSPIVPVASMVAERSLYLEDSGRVASLRLDENYHDLPQGSRSSRRVGSSKEFKFDNADGAPAEASVGSDWWANEKVSGAETSPRKKWAFFPMMQPAVS